MVFDRVSSRRSGTDWLIQRFKRLPLHPLGWLCLQLRRKIGKLWVGRPIRDLSPAYFFLRTCFFPSQIIHLAQQSAHPSAGFLSDTHNQILMMLSIPAVRFWGTEGLDTRVLLGILSSLVHRSPHSVEFENPPVEREIDASLGTCPQIKSNNEIVFTRVMRKHAFEK